MPPIRRHRVMLNCPPAPEDGDDHGYIMIKMLSELSSELVSGRSNSMLGSDFFFMSRY